MKLTLTVTEGPLAGRRFRLIHEGVYVFGRHDDLPGFLGEDDFLSGQHFEVELRASAAVLRDAGSRNGTRLNGRRLMPARVVLGTDGSQSVESGSPGDEMLLADGDAIFAGATALGVTLEVGPTCSECGASIASGTEEAHRWIGGTYLCAACRADLAERDEEQSRRARGHEQSTISFSAAGAPAEPPTGGEVVTCARCGAPVEALSPPPSGRPLLPVCSRCSGATGVLLHELEASLRDASASPAAGDLEAALAALAATGPVTARAPAPSLGQPSNPAGERAGEFSFTVLDDGATTDGAGGEFGVPSLDDFEVGARVERTHQGEVHRARRRSDGREVLLRRIDAPSANVEVGRRFVRAFAPWLQHEHRRLVAPLLAGCGPGHVFVAYQAVDGRRLPRFANLSASELRLDTIVELGLQCLAALGALHGAGAIHGDLRPESVVVGGDPDRLDVRVGEAGLTRTLQECGLLGADAWRPLLTALPWMAPELARNPGAVTPATDLYAAGAILYQLLTEHPPRALPTVPSDPARVLTDIPPTPLRWYRPDASPALEAFVARALAPDPGARFASATEMAEALQAIDTGWP